MTILDRPTPRLRNINRHTALPLIIGSQREKKMRNANGGDISVRTSCRWIDERGRNAASGKQGQIVSDNR